MVKILKHHRTLVRRCYGRHLYGLGFRYLHKTKWDYFNGILQFTFIKEYSIQASNYSYLFSVYLSSPQQSLIHINNLQILSISNSDGRIACINRFPESELISIKLFNFHANHPNWLQKSIKISRGIYYLLTWSKLF